MAFIESYSWHLNNMGVNCASPLIRRFVSRVNTTVVHNPWLVESEGAELQITQGDYKPYMDFLFFFLVITAPFNKALFCSSSIGDIQCLI